MKRVFNSQKELNEAVAYWQKKLRLEDWDIQARFRRAHYMPPNAVGYCDFDLQHKSAIISILPKVDHNPSSFTPYNAQRTLVHEMLHVMFARLKQDGDEIEVVINQLSRSLVGAK